MRALGGLTWCRPIVCFLVPATAGGVLAASLPMGVEDTQNLDDRLISALEALKKMRLPEGFQATVFAGEPDLFQPIAFDFDDRGRLWVVECFSYPDMKPANRDRIVILEDSDGDGQMDRRNVFFDKGHHFTGIQLGFGGVWVTSAPELIFIPDRDRDDVPDGEPEPRLDGWTLDASHNVVNGLAWGPDGWLYGRHGILAESRPGRPGTPLEMRPRIKCGIWRYHPTRHDFEIVLHGTTNPWGMDWDEHGQAFFYNSVIGHLWHVIPGARCNRMFGADYNPHAYELMAPTSDHLHFAGGDWTKSRGGHGPHRSLGGGHAHCGAMIYQGDNWPDSYRNVVIMGNLHGNRLLFDHLKRSGSGYVASHGETFLESGDPWFRAVTIKYGPDGGVFVSDWNDFRECHDQDGVYRSSGRIYKITYGQITPRNGLDMAIQSDRDLVEWILHKNEWFTCHARRLLQERSMSGTLDPGAVRRMKEIFSDVSEPSRKIRALWALHVTGHAGEWFLERQLDHPSEHIRWWAIRLLTTEGRVSAGLSARLARMSHQDESALVRLALACALQKLPFKDRWEIGEGLASHADDSEDPSLPLMIWYGMEPAMASNPVKALEFARNSRIRKLRHFIIRRLAVEKGEK